MKKKLCALAVGAGMAFGLPSTGSAQTGNNTNTNTNNNVNNNVNNVIVGGDEININLAPRPILIPVAPVAHPVAVLLPPHFGAPVPVHHPHHDVVVPHHVPAPHPVSVPHHVPVPRHVPVVHQTQSQHQAQQQTTFFGHQSQQQSQSQFQSGFGSQSQHQSQSQSQWVR